jgi:hypothetical protein
MTRWRLSILTCLLLAGFATPAVQAHPIDDATAFVERTIAYVQAFNPTDNETTQQAKTQEYLKDINFLGNLMSRTICTGFSMGPIYVDPTRITVTPFNTQAHFEVPGFGANSHRSGLGMYTIAVNENGTGTCTAPLV